MAKHDPAAGRADVEAYLAMQPPAWRDALEDLRRRIVARVPDASEGISYGMPAVRYRNRFIVSYAGWARHCSLYPLTGSARLAHAAELEGLSTDKGTIRFTPPQRPSDELLATILADRMASIDAGGR